jgi:hypothetical protein
VVADLPDLLFIKEQRPPKGGAGLSKPNSDATGIVTNPVRPAIGPGGDRQIDLEWPRLT